MLLHSHLNVCNALFVTLQVNTRSRHVPQPHSPSAATVLFQLEHMQIRVEQHHHALQLPMGFICTHLILKSTGV